MRRVRIVFAVVCLLLAAGLALLVRRAVGSVALERQMRHRAVADRVFDEMERALSEAKAGQPVKQQRCTSPVAMQFDIGQRVGVNGTPAVFAADGTQLGGYLPPQQLLQALEGGGAEAAGGSR